MTEPVEVRAKQWKVVLAGSGTEEVFVTAEDWERSDDALLFYNVADPNDPARDVVAMMMVEHVAAVSLWRS